MAQTSYFQNLEVITVNGIPLRDIFSRIRIENLFDTLDNMMEIVTIKPEETLEILANNLYGSPTFFWVILISNNYHDWLYDLELSDTELRAKVNKYMETAPTGTNENEVYTKWRAQNEYRRFLYALKPGFLPVLLDKITEEFS